MVMMLHTGVPGSGKTYLMVHKMINSYFEWDKEKEAFLRKKEFEKLVIISNIESLSVEHKDLDELMETRCHALAKKKAAESGVSDLDVINEYYWEFYKEKVRWFFDYDYQKRLTEYYGGGIVYCIEEVQNYFDTKRFSRAPWARDVCYYFEKHRHMGHSVYMDTQHSSKIAPDIRVLFETEIAAKPRTMSVMGEFRYNELSDGIKINQMPIVCKPDKKIFSCYQSMAALETVKTKKPIRKLVFGIVFAAVFCVSVFAYAKHKIYSDAGISPPVENDLPVSTFAPSPFSSSSSSSSLPQSGAWFRLSWVDKEDFIYFYNPVDMVLQKSSFFPYRIRRSGPDYFAFIPDDFTSKKQSSMPSIIKSGL